ncbi:MAG: hypothetical protein SXG53_25430 [Pseudomonadota bacterium]|nr:hypothetical protein [Pseudomonadota bacterium]
MRAEMINAFRVSAGVVILMICGCASSSATTPDSHQFDAQPGFEATLHTCRKLQPGRLNQRLNLPADSLRVSECLRQRGWEPDGSRSAPAEAR